MDKAHRQTDKIIARIQAEIEKVYADGQTQIEKMYKSYFSQFEDADAKKLAELEAEAITKKEYIDWRLQTITTGRKWNDFVIRVAEAINDLNNKATEISNRAMDEAFIENYNYAGEDIKKRVKKL